MTRKTCHLTSINELPPARLLVIHLPQHLQIFWFRLNRRPNMVSQSQLLLMLLTRKPAVLSLRKPVVDRCQRTVTDEC